MSSMWRWFVCVVALVLAVLMHVFYVDYEVKYGFKDSPYLVSWPATPFQRHSVIDQVARSMVRPRQVRVDYAAVGEWHQLRANHFSRYCEYFTRGPKRIIDARCSKEFDIPEPKPKTIVTPAVSYAAAQAYAAKKYASSPISFGMVPSLVVAGDNPSRTSFVKSYWLGVIVPTALFGLSLFMLVAVIRARIGDVHSSVITGSQPQGLAAPQVANSEGARSVLGEADSSGQPPRSNPTLSDLIKSDLGEDFPVSGGNGKDDSPLVITATRDYVSVEYAVVGHVLTTVREEFKLSKQALHNRGGRMIDELIFDVKAVGASDWTGRRRFYFDITAGFDSLG